MQLLCWSCFSRLNSECLKSMREWRVSWFWATRLGSTSRLYVAYEQTRRAKNIADVDVVHDQRYVLDDSTTFIFLLLQQSLQSLDDVHIFSASLSTEHATLDTLDYIHNSRAEQLRSRTESSNHSSFHFYYVKLKFKIFSISFSFRLSGGEVVHLAWSVDCQ